MHIALCGPATVSMLEPHLGVKVASSGYPYALVPTLAEQLIAMGHRVTVVSSASDIVSRQQYEGVELRLVLVPSRPRPRKRALDLFRLERRALAEALRDTRPDVIHAQWTYEFALAAAEASIAPVLVTARDSPLKILRLNPDPYRFFRLLLAIRARPSIRHLSVPSPYLARSLRWFGYFGQIPVIPNLLPMQSTIASGTYKESAPRVLCVADSGRRKNVPALLRAMAAVRLKYPNAQLRLVGEGLGQGGPLETWARQQGLDSNVDFVGHVDRLALAGEYASASVFCSPSLEESFGNTLLEALQTGLPVVAGERSGAVPWVLFDGLAGRLIDVRDPDAIAGAICDAINDPSSTIASGFDVARAIENRYAPAAVATAYLAEYRRIIELAER